MQRQRLLGCDGEGLGILIYRIGNRPPEGKPLERSGPCAVQNEIRPGQRVHPSEVGRITDCCRIDDPKIDRDHVTLSKRYDSR